MKEFFRSRPADLLIGDGVTADMLTADVCGRTLDAISKYGIEKFFYSIISLIDRDHDIIERLIKIDTSSFSFQGKYSKGQNENEKLASGHSKDGRPDLFQLILWFFRVFYGYRSSLEQ